MYNRRAMDIEIRKYSRLFIALLCVLLVVQPVSAQTELRIVIVSGEGARNVTQQIAPAPITIRIQDAGGRPVAGANVTFTAPEGGPSGEFENDSRTITVMSSVDGVASAGTYHPNSVAGEYLIQVRAEFQGQTASAVVLQWNVERKSRRKLIAILGLAGAAVGAALAARGGGNQDTTTTPPRPAPPTISFGGSAVGAPNR